MDEHFFFFSRQWVEFPLMFPNLLYRNFFTRFL